MKLKIKVTYEWEEEADELIHYYMDNLNISLKEAKENFEDSSPHIESLCKLDWCVDNCINTAYKSKVLMEGKIKMGRITTTTIICDRCEKPMAQECGYDWIWFDHKKKPFYKLLHEVPSWNRKDEILLCDDCAEEFRQWMLEKKSTDS